MAKTHLCRTLHHIIFVVSLYVSEDYVRSTFVVDMWCNRLYGYFLHRIELLKQYVWLFAAQ